MEMIASQPLILRRINQMSYSRSERIKLYLITTNDNFSTNMLQATLQKAMRLHCATRHTEPAGTICTIFGVCPREDSVAGSFHVLNARTHPRRAAIS